MLLAKVLKLDRAIFAGNVESILVRGGDNCLKKAAVCSLSLKWLAGSGYGPCWGHWSLCCYTDCRKQVPWWILLLYVQREWRGHYSEIGRNLVTLKSLQIPHPLSWWSQSLYSSFILTPNSMSLGWHSHAAGPSSTVDHFCKETKLQVRSVLQLRLPLEGRLVTKVTTIPDAPEWGCFILERPPNLYSWSVSQYFNSENFMK